MTSRGGSRVAPLLGVAQAMVILCLRSIFHIAYKCGTGGILVYSSTESLPWLQYGDNLVLPPYLGNLVLYEACVKHCVQPLVCFGS